jgi:hypothetical protein
MSESDEKPGRRFSPVALCTAAFGLLFMPVLYVLSVGPVCWYANSHASVPEWLEYAFTWYVLPLELVIMAIPDLIPWLELYLEWWQ